MFGAPRTAKENNALLAKMRKVGEAWNKRQLPNIELCGTNIEMIAKSFRCDYDKREDILVLRNNIVMLAGYFSG